MTVAEWRLFDRHSIPPDHFQYELSNLRAPRLAANSSSPRSCDPNLPTEKACAASECLAHERTGGDGLQSTSSCLCNIPELAQRRPP